MPGTISMDTEQVRAAAALCLTNAKNMEAHIDELWVHVQRLERNWEGGEKQKFIQDSFFLKHRFETLLDQLFNFQTRLEREIDEWEYADRKLGSPNNAEHGNLFVMGSGDSTTIHASDIAQGATGDCYLLASLAALANANPDLIREMITQNADGSYTVRFFNEQTGQAEYVTIKAEDIPLGYNGEPRFAQYGDNGELWPAVIEKAYAEWIDQRNIRDPGWSQFLEKLGFEGKSDYKLISGGLPQVAMQQLTGGDSAAYVPTTFSEADLMRNLNEGNLVTLGTLQPTDPAVSGNSLYTGNNAQLATAHAYYITNYDPATGMVEVRNPWGWNHQQGCIYLPLETLQQNIAMIAVNDVP